MEQQNDEADIIFYKLGEERFFMDFTYRIIYNIHGGDIMPGTGDSYVVELKNAHLMWGEYHPSRHSHSRGTVYGEGYIKIPSHKAYSLQIFNSNNPFGISELYKCVSYDGYYNGVLKAQGNQCIPFYAKQFAEDGNLKGIGDWYDYVGAAEGDYVKIKFISINSMIIEHSISSSGFHI